MANGRPKEDGWAGSGGSVRLNGAWDNNNINGHSPLFENVMFKSNQTKEGNPDESNRSSISYGGAVFGEASNPSFRNTVFQDNLSITAGAAIAILYPDTNKIISFEKTTFINNQILFSGSATLGSMGAGIYLEQAGPVIINNSIFDGNALALSGECCWNGGAAVMINRGTSPVIVRNSKFLNNHIYTPQGRNGGTAKGGAIFISEVNGDFELINSLFVNNSAEAGLRTYEGKTFDVDAQGGALYIRLSFYVDQNGNPSAPYESRLINNTFVENKAFSSGNLEGRGANISYDGYNKAILLNNIFAADTVNNIQNPQSFEEYSIAGLFNGEIFSGYNNSDREQLVGLLNEFGDNNIQRDPSFLLDEGQDPYQLSDASRLIGA
ncbi:MAG: hypothetical protein HOH13_01890, partial [Crocinitomicaceae bacterium]|nr:hypothetical protein [Crocinitomicaceae bacterium]